MIQRFRLFFDEVLDFYKEPQEEIQKLADTIESNIIQIISESKQTNSNFLKIEFSEGTSEWDLFSEFISYNKYKQARIIEMITDKYSYINLRFQIIKDTIEFIPLNESNVQIMYLQIVWDYDFNQDYDYNKSIFDKLNYERSIVDRKEYRQKTIISYIDSILLAAINTIVTGEFIVEPDNRRIVSDYKFEGSMSIEEFNKLRETEEKYYAAILNQYGIELNILKCVDNITTIEIIKNR